MAESGFLVSDPSQIAGLNSGANLGGSSLAGFLTPNPTSAAGGADNPFTSTLGMPAGSKTLPASGPTPAPMPTAPFSSPYTPSGATATLTGLETGLGNTPPGQNTLFGLPATVAQQNDIAKGFQAAGLPGGVGTALSAFLMSGAGYSPAVAKALIDAMQPQIAKGQANLMEQFGSHGLSMSSPAALAMGDYEAQTNLDVGTLLAGLYEQSVQNYINVLSLGKTQKQQGGGILGSLGGFLGGAGQGIGSILTGLGGGAAAGGSSAAELAATMAIA